MADNPLTPITFSGQKIQLILPSPEESAVLVQTKVLVLLLAGNAWQSNLILVWVMSTSVIISGRQQTQLCTTALVMDVNKC